MMRMLRRVAAVGLLLASLSGAGADAAADRPAVAFTKKVAAERTDAGVKIEFAVNVPTDVAVYIEDAGGKVVCHMAGGMLGRNAPPPLKSDSLEQSLVWDGKDDWGKLAGPGPFKVRVALGMTCEFDGFLLHNPEGCGRVHALAVGPGGTVYVFHAENTANDNMGGHKIKVYTRDGRHVKALVPFPADIAAEKVKALGVFQDDDGSLIPRVHNWETLSFYPDAVGSRGRDMPDAASSPAVDSRGRVYWLVRGPSLCAVDADGGIPYEMFLGPKLLTDIKGVKMAGETWEYWPEHPVVAVSSDDKYVYFAGLSAGSGPLPCVFRVPAETRGPAEVFVGKLGQAGKEKELLTAPRGLAVAKGLLYVADPAADRVAVFKEADRSFAGEIQVKSPQCIGVDPGTGAVYVCAYAAKGPAELIKMSGLEDGRALYRMTLPGTGMSPNPGQHRIAVDASAKPVRIWLPELMYAVWSLKCIEDAGDKFTDIGDPRDRAPWAEGPRDLSIDRTRGELYVKCNVGKMNAQKWWRLDERTGAILKDFDPKTGSTASGTQVVPGPDGNLYTMSFGAGLLRFDHEGKPLNFEGRTTNNIPIGGTMNFQQRYLALRPYGPADELYVVVPPFYRQILEEKMSWDDAAKKASTHLPGRYTSLNVIGQDGKTRRTVIWQCLDSAVVRVDRWGNIYLVDSVKPPDRSWPEFFDAGFAGSGKAARGSDRFWTSAMYGSIMKFPPSGGAIWFTKDKSPLSCVGSPPAELLAKPELPFKSPYSSGYNVGKAGGVQGALWVRFGYSPYSMPGSGGMCNCEGSGFDVDAFGRVFFPNLGRSRVEVIDTNNNPIAAFGKYGNEDSGGPKARVAKPAIPFAWPVYVAVSDTHAYVADTVNRRVVRVRLGCSAEERAAVP